MTLDEMIANRMDPNTEVEIPLQEFIKLKKMRNMISHDIIANLFISMGANMLCALNGSNGQITMTVHIL